jgi:hypothetical protein
MFITVFTRPLQEPILRTIEYSLQCEGVDSTPSHDIYLRSVLILYSHLSYPKQQEDVSLVFYDLENTYDSVPRKLLWQALEKANVSKSVTQIIRNIYSNNKCRIKIRSNLSDEFCNTKGLL